jgi:hypothetical protein
MAEASPSFFEILETQKRALEHRGGLLNRRIDSSADADVREIVDSFSGTLIELIDRETSLKAAQKIENEIRQNHMILVSELKEKQTPLAEAYLDYEKQVRLTNMGAKAEPWALSNDELEKAQKALASAIETKKSKLASLASPPWKIYAPWTWPVVTAGARLTEQKNLTSDLDLLDKASDRMNVLRQAFDIESKAVARRRIRPIVAQIRHTAARKAIARRDQNSVTAIDSLLSYRYKSFTCPLELSRYEIMPQRKEVDFQVNDLRVADFPDLLDSNGALAWRRVYSLARSDTPHQRSFLFSTAKDRANAMQQPAEEEKAKKFYEEWGVRDVAELKELFESPSREVCLSYGPQMSENGKIQSLNISYLDSNTRKLVLSANVFYYPRKRKLGIESVQCSDNYRGQGDFKNFMRGVVEWGEKRRGKFPNAVCLTLLAEKDGSHVWARLGAKIAPYGEQTRDMAARENESYLGWSGVVYAMRSLLFPLREPRHPIPELNENTDALAKIIGRRDDPDPPQDALWQLVSYPEKIDGRKAIDFLLQPNQECSSLRYKAIWNFNDPEQMGRLKKAIGFGDDAAQPVLAKAERPEATQTRPDATPARFQR